MIFFHSVGHLENFLHIFHEIYIYMKESRGTQTLKETIVTTTPINQQQKSLEMSKKSQHGCGRWAT